uniref:RdRp n=1 Tax=viral metagenome TaxID=1070528 RepID=A0A2V0RAI3_9ZZZZ
MQTFDLRDFESSFTTNGFEKLSRSNARIMKGSNLVLITPAAERAGPTNIYEAWLNEFESYSEAMNPDLLELEREQMSKFTPRSIAKPGSQLIPGVYDSFEPVKINTSGLRPFSNPNANLRPRSIEHSAQATRSNTQAGCPTLEKKGLERENTVRHFASLYSQNLTQICAIRTQEDGKTRIVYIYPYVDIIQENRYFLPLFSVLREQTEFSAFKGPDAVDLAVTKLLLKAKDNPSMVCVSGDVSGFDDSVKKQLQESGFAEIKSYFQANYIDELDEIALRFGTKPLVLPNEQVLVGWHGIPSGSNFTGILGSVVNRQVLNSTPDDCQVMGDDFVVITDNPDEIFARYEQKKLNIHPTKTKIKPSSFVYLQRLHSLDLTVDGLAKGVYPTFRALTRLVYPERRSDFDDYGLKGRDYFAIRSLTILENCKNHPLFEKFVKFWLSYEKYVLPSKSSIPTYVRMMETKSVALGTTNQYGDAVEGIQNFESFKIARGLVG